MRNALLQISSLLAITLALLSCGRTPDGVLSVNEMADLIVDLQLADAYIDSHSMDYESDSSMLVMKQSIFKKHGITQEDYDSSLVWYAHNMEDYNKAYDKAVNKLKERYDKLDPRDNSQPEDMMAGPTGAPTHSTQPRAGGPNGKHLTVPTCGRVHATICSLQGPAAASSRLISRLRPINIPETAISFPTSCCVEAMSSK